MNGVQERAASRSSARAPRPLSPSKVWERRYLLRLVLGHSIALLVALGLSLALRYPLVPKSPPGVLPAWVQGLIVVAFWLLMLQLARAFEIRSLGVGAEEFKRIARATGWTFACAAMVAWVFNIEISRWLVAILLPLGFAGLCLSTLINRRWLHVRRRRGQNSYNVIAVGTRVGVEHLVSELSRAPFAGLKIVGACLPEQDGHETLKQWDIPVLGFPEQAAVVAEEYDIDVVATAGTAGLPSTYLRQLGWDLEGTGRKLLVAPGMANMAGPRITMIPVAGVPLVWVDEPQFTGIKRVAKTAVDLIGGLILLILAAPVLLITALAIKLDSRGPVFFRQLRTGTNGEPFRVWKFRSMYVDAEERRAEMQTQNESDGHLFKMQNDPRVTRVGRLIRRTSVDELPQLINVVQGTMSLVGPRPLPVTDSTYEGHALRRLLVRPGITGLWQVNGRSNTTWEEAMRLDLYYVENWSLSLDLVILARTVAVVLRGEGAY